MDSYERNSNSGKHTVKSFYHLDRISRSSNENVQARKSLWNLRIHERFQNPSLEDGRRMPPLVWF